MSFSNKSSHSSPSTTTSCGDNGDAAASLCPKSFSTLSPTKRRSRLSLSPQTANPNYRTRVLSTSETHTTIISHSPSHSSSCGGMKVASVLTPLSTSDTFTPSACTSAPRSLNSLRSTSYKLFAKHPIDLSCGFHRVMLLVCLLFAVSGCHAAWSMHGANRLCLDHRAKPCEDHGMLLKLTGEDF